MTEFEQLMSAGFAEARTVLTPSSGNAQIIGPARAVTVDPATDTIAFAAHPYVAGDGLRLGGTLPGGTLAGRTYYVRDVTADAFKIAATATGAALDLTTAGANVTVSGVKACVLSNVNIQRVLAETGFKPTYTAIAELTREEAATILLYPMETGTDRPLCTVAGRSYKRDDIEDDPHDGTVRLHLRPLRR